MVEAAPRQPAENSRSPGRSPARSPNRSPLRVPPNDAAQQIMMMTSQASQSHMGGLRIKNSVGSVHAASQLPPPPEITVVVDKDIDMTTMNQNV